MRLAEMVYTEEEMQELRKENKKFKEICDVYVPRALKLEEENKKLRYKIRKLKSIRKMFDNCIAFAFLCFMCSWILCMFFEMITDVIMWFQFVR